MNGEGDSVGPLTEEERRVLAALDLDGLVRAVFRLVGIPSWGGDEVAVQEVVAAMMADAGLEVDLWEIDLDEVGRHPAYSAELHRDRALGLVGVLSGAGAGPTLVLNGHVDVVPPGDAAAWRHPPFSGRVEEGRIYGRGALDMKGPFLCGLFAAKAVRDSGVPLGGSVQVQSVVGEEDGGCGTLATILRGHRGDAAVVMEPTDLTVAPAQAGALNFRIHVPGQAAHGAVRHEGVSALENAFLVYAALEGLEAERNRLLGGDPLFAEYAVPFPICVGRIEGGDWASSVPDHVVLEGRLGVAPGEALEQARAALEQAVRSAAQADPFLRGQPPRVEWWGGRFLPARTPPDHPLPRILQGALRTVNGGARPMRGMTYGADMGLLHGVAGIPTVLFGPGDIRGAHRPDESIAVEDLAQAARILAVMILRFCGVADGTTPGEGEPPAPADVR